MTTIPTSKTCPTCHKKYVLNPDAGDSFCPYCMEKGKKKTDILGRILGNNKPIGNMPDEITVTTENPKLGSNGMPHQIKVKIDK